ncbi:MAG TPA: hypothetical protein VFQ60_00185 [Patescibacteria group bacterium]|nr:hypothetical protein [Patescibacteria group bacterium]
MPRKERLFAIKWAPSPLAIQEHGGMNGRELELRCYEIIDGNLVGPVRLIMGHICLMSGRSESMLWKIRCIRGTLQGSTERVVMADGTLSYHELPERRETMDLVPCTGTLKWIAD